MKETVFTGCATALVTPFSDGEVDYKSLKRLIEYNISAGVDALVVCGTTGEAATMSGDEQSQVISFAADTVAGRVPLIAGTGSNDTSIAVKRTVAAAQAGADAALVVTPYYNKATDSGLVRHYHAVADASSVPVIMYNVPTRTCVDIKPETVKLLSSHENIVALKEASPDVSKAARIISMCGDNFAVYSGNDDLALPLMSLGGKGVISVVSNIIPDIMSELCHAFLTGDCRGAAKTESEYYSLMKMMFIEVNPIPVKTALAEMGLCQDEVRLPMCEMTAENREKLVKELIDHGLI